MKIINDELLDTVIEQAKNSPRLRMNHNIHKKLDDNVQQLLNALEPGTVLPIHRHPTTSETYMIVKGSMNILFYNEKNELTDTILLKSTEGNYGVNIPINQWHTVEVLESGTVIFEVKEGPYKPNESKDIMVLDK